MEDEDLDLAEATLDLPVEGYHTWLKQRQREEIVGVRPSASRNPLAEYIRETVGIYCRLHTDGRHAWFILQLTKLFRGDNVKYMRMLLPDWTVPLVMDYTSFAIQQTSGQPQEKNVSASAALCDLDVLVEEAHRHSEGGDKD